MKISLSSLILLVTSSCAFGQGQAFLNQPQKVKPELRYGVEATTAWRSEYIYRGFELAENSMEFQLAGQVSLSNSDTLDLGLYYGSATSDGDFSESGAFIDFSRNIGDLTYAAKLSVRDYSNAIFESGADIGASVNYVVNDNIDLTGLVSYDTGAEGFYFEGKFSYYRQINEDSYFTFDTGLGIVADYYQRNGVHQAFAKLAYTYNINDSVSLSPYVQMNLGIHDQAQDHLVAGAYFAVSF